MKFKYGQNQTIIQTIKHKQTGAKTRFVVCKFDENGELETNDPKIIHILQTKVTGCTWEDSESYETKEVIDIMSDEDIRAIAKENHIKSYHNKKIDNIKVELEEMGVI